MDSEQEQILVNGIKENVDSLNKLVQIADTQGVFVDFEIMDIHTQRGKYQHLSVKIYKTL